MSNRTDLALESYENREATRLKGVCVMEKNNLTTVEVLDENGAKEIGKPIGKYQTLKVNSFVNDTDLLDGRLQEFADILDALLPKNIDSVLVVGLGNEKITADSLGPIASSFVLATRHIVSEMKDDLGLGSLFSVSAISTGVLAQTGIESAEIILGVVNQIKPSCVIVIDALASASMERLGTTVQLSDVGIAPGSGVGNHRYEISKKTLGVPVISIGIPTVVSTSVINEREDTSAFVTPREIDEISRQGAKLIGMGINVCLQKDLSVNDLMALVG